MLPQREQQVDSQTMYEGKIVSVRVDRVLLPDGKTIVTREVVDHKPAVVIVPIDAEGNVLLVRQFRYPAGETLLEAPAGGVEDGESPDNCAQRELQEETGHVSRDLRILGGFWTTPGFCTEFMYAYLARDLVPSKGNPDP
ncbi:MAG: NUDIX hydrolase, partial [Chloroflexi bacterium]|nr:NUDIX hydrolase [Chloroflexota bacterium]